MFSFLDIIVKLWSSFAHRKHIGFYITGVASAQTLMVLTFKFSITLFTLLVAEDVIALRGNFHRDVYFVAVSDNSFATSKVWN